MTHKWFGVLQRFVMKLWRNKVMRRGLPVPVAAQTLVLFVKSHGTRGVVPKKTRSFSGNALSAETCASVQSAKSGCKKRSRTCSNGRRWNVRHEVLVDQPLAFLRHGDSQIFLMVITTQLHHREDKESDPHWEGDPNSELCRRHLDVESVGIDVVGLNLEEQILNMLNI